MTDREKLAGGWGIVSLEVEGNRVGAGAFSSSQIVMEGDRFTTVSMGAAYGGTFTVDESVTPRQLDLLFTEGPHAGQVSPAIYKLEDESLTICLGFAGRSRPEEFKTTSGSGHALETLRRLPEVAAAAPAGQAEVRHPAPRDSAAQPAEETAGTSQGPGVGAQPAASTASASPAADAEDLAALQGEWAMVFGQMNGESLPAQFVKTARRVVRGGEVTVTFGGQVYLKAAFAIDAGTVPKSMDYTLLDGLNVGQRQLGIYELGSDTLRICYAQPGCLRPTEFSSSLTEERTLSEWKRKA